MKKSQTIQFLLTLVFGPLGLFYSTVAGAFGLILIGLAVGALTAGVGAFVFWPISIVVGMYAVSRHNSEVEEEANRHEELLNAIQAEGVPSRAISRAKNFKPNNRTIDARTILILGAFLGVGYLIVHSGGSSQSTALLTPNAKQRALDKIGLDFKWSMTGATSVMEADFTITNNGTQDVKDIEIRCDHFAKSGTRIDRNVRTIYDVFPAGTTRTIRKLNMGFMDTQVEKSACAVEDLVLVPK